MEASMESLQAQIYNMIKTPQLAGFATLTEDGKPWVRYVMVVASEDLSLRFASFVHSRKVAHITKNPEVHVLCGVSSLEKAESYLQIQGKAEVLTDHETRHKYWNPGYSEYFKGPDDPNYCIILIKPYRIELCSMATAEPLVWEAK
jgi:general stress protein 26